MHLNSMEEGKGEGLKEPKHLVFQDEDSLSFVSYEYDSSSISNDVEQSRRTADRDLKLQSSEDAESTVNPAQQNGADPVLKDNNLVTQHEKASKEEIRWIQQEKAAQESIKMVTEMKDQMVGVRLFFSMPSVANNTHLVKETNQRIKDLDQETGEAFKDSDLSRSATNKRRAMDSTLRKAHRLLHDCTALDSKLRTQTSKAIQELQEQKNQKEFLLDLAGTTTPKGLHCLSMRLTTEYFSLPSGIGRSQNSEECMTQVSSIMLFFLTMCWPLQWLLIPPSPLA